MEVVTTRGWGWGWGAGGGGGGGGGGVPPDSSSARLMLACRMPRGYFYRSPSLLFDSNARLGLYNYILIQLLRIR